MSDDRFWSDEWMDLQRRYWESWCELSHRAEEDGAHQDNPWENALDHWWQAVSPNVPEMPRDFMEKMMEQGKRSFHLAEIFVQNLKGSGSADDFAEALNSAFGDVRQRFTDAVGGDGAPSLNKIAAYWDEQLDGWRRMASVLSPLSPNMAQGNSTGFIDQMLSIPGLGITREDQEQQQEMVRRLRAYQEAFQEYAAFFSGLGVLAVDRMQQQVEQLLACGEKIDSARKLNDIWISSCEAVYSEQVMTPEYARLHGGLVNTLMSVRQQMTLLNDRYLGAMNLPTHGELKTLQARTQENRREIRALKSELAELKAQLAKSEATRKKTATKRKVAKKKSAKK